MRLYDRLLSIGANREGQLVSATRIFPPQREVVRIDINNVRAYVLDSGKEVWTPGDAPNIAPPWPLAWVEWIDKGEASLTSFERHQIGVRRASVGLDSGAWFVMEDAFVWHHSEARIPAWLGTRYSVVSPDGAAESVGFDRWMSAPERAQLEEMHKVRFGLGNRQYRLKGQTGSTEAENHAKMQDLSGLLFYSDLAMSFAHCKNVKVVDHATPPKVAAKRRKAGKPVGTTYKTLVIDPMKEVLRTEGGIEKNGLKKALHICRGHFATYTDDKPLFGKVTGTFWKPMHVRGDKKRGEVKKDYRVLADKM